MAETIYEEHVVGVSSRKLLGPQTRGIPKCHEAEVTPLVHLRGSMECLPVGQVTVRLMSGGTADGCGVQTVGDGVPASFTPSRGGAIFTNTNPIVFRLDEQPTIPIPLVGIFVDDVLVMRGALRLCATQASGADMNEPQIRLDAGTLKLKIK